MAFQQGTVATDKHAQEEQLKIELKLHEKHLMMKAEPELTQTKLEIQN